jgi:MFS family permease
VSAPAPVRPRILTTPFILAWLVNLLHGLSFFMFIHLPRFLAELGADEVVIGLIVAASALASIAIRPAVGTALDRRGRRPAILVGGMLNAISVPLYFTVGSVGPWLVAVRILHGLSAALLFTSISTYGADQVPEERRTRGVTLFAASSMLPAAIGGWVGDLVLAAGGFHGVLFAALGFATTALLLSIPLPEQRPVRADLAPARPRGAFRRALTQRSLLPLWHLTLWVGIALTGYSTFMRTYVDDTGIGSVGLFFLTYACTAVALRLFFSWVPDRVGRPWVLYPSLGAIAAGYLTLAFGSSTASIALAGVLCGGGLGYVYPLIFAGVVDRSSAEERGSAMAAFSLFFDAGALVGSPLLGWVILHFGYAAMFATAGVVVALAALAFAAWDGDLARRRRPTAEGS